MVRILERGEGDVNCDQLFWVGNLGSGSHDRGQNWIPQTEQMFSGLPPKANVGMGQTRSGRSARLSPKVLAISAHTIFKLEQTAGAALNDALLRQIVDNLRRHPKTARQSVG